VLAEARISINSKCSIIDAYMITLVLYRG
jgi:hypothetical protein